MLKPIEKILETPWGYKLCQTILISRGNRRIREFVCAALPNNPQSHILDIGCGTQDYSDDIPGDFTGIDINPAYIEYCASHFRGTYRTMDATRLDFPDQSFDAVFNVGLCHHLSRDQIRLALAEWVRVLKPGGVMLIVDAVLPLQWWNLAGYALRKMDRGGHVLPWAEWQKVFRESCPVENSELSTFSSFPYDFSALRLRRDIRDIRDERDLRQNGD